MMTNCRKKRKLQYDQLCEHYPEYNIELYKKRQEKIEHIFADAKEKHGMRYTRYRDLDQETD